MKKILLLVLLTIIGSWFLFKEGRGPQIQLDVVEGMTAHHVARELVDKGVLKSKHMFLIWVKLRQASQKIHVGRYRFPLGHSAFQIVDDIVEGRTHKVKVVIPEGFASWQIGARLEEEGVCSKDEFIQVVKEKKLEGYLFPATYELDYSLKASSVAGMLKARFESAWTEELMNRAKELKMTQHQVLTLASIVEREVRVRDEAPMISAVYHNRLKRGMRLEADPTVQFAKGEWVSRLTYADYRNTKSPYNTYRIKGLPPGPICSPGIDSIRAALWPAKTKDLFFVAMEDGRHSFSSSYIEHTNKVNKRNRLRRIKK